MRKGLVWSVIAVIVVLIAIQLAPLDTTNPPVEQDIPTSPEVKAILHRACYDCHSNETVWPWYSRIAPISWLIVRFADVIVITAIGVLMKVLGHLGPRRGHLSHHLSPWAPALRADGSGI